MAAKKTAKKAAKKSSKKTIFDLEDQEQSKAFDLLGGGRNIASLASLSLRKTLSGKKNRVVNAVTQDKLKIETLDVRSLYMQWCIDALGLPKGQMFEFVGRDKLGKTSLLYWMFGGFLLQGSPCMVVASEGKPLSQSWSMRCLSSDPDIGAKMLSQIGVVSCSNLDEMEELVRAWIKSCRSPESESFVPLHIPLVLAIDPINKLTTKAEAAGGNYVYKSLNTETPVEMADRGHTWDRAKVYHDFVRRIGAEAEQLNLMVFFNSHQNDQVMGTGGPSFIPQYVIDLKNRTKAGGQALNQHVSLQMILADKGKIYSGGQEVARRVIMKPYKNSYGPDNRSCCFAIKSDNYEDEEGYLDSGIRWDYTMVEWFAENNYFGFKEVGNSRQDPRYSSRELGFTGISLLEAAKIVRELPPEDISELGRKLGIPGHVNVMENIMASCRRKSAERDVQVSEEEKTSDSVDEEVS